MRDRRGFTLIELLVVISIIAILVSIILPIVSRARDSSNSVGCANNLRGIAGAFMGFAADHDGQLPGSYNTGGSPNPDARDWLLDTTGSWKTGPQGGTLWRYTKTKAMYRCPTYAAELPGSGQGSNGNFDYSAFACLAGAPLRSVNPISRVQLLNGTYAYYPTPMVCQEDPSHINGSNMEGRHSNTDQMGHMHNGGSYFAAVDGSAQWVNEPNTGVANSGSDGTHRWYSQSAHSHNWIQMSGDLAWGAWASQ